MAGRLFLISRTICTLLRQQYKHFGVNNMHILEATIHTFFSRQYAHSGLDLALKNSVHRCHMSPFFGTTRHWGVLLLNIHIYAYERGTYMLLFNMLSPYCPFPYKRGSVFRLKSFYIHFRPQLKIPLLKYWVTDCAGVYQTWLLITPVHNRLHSSAHAYCVLPECTLPAGYRTGFTKASPTDELLSNKISWGSAQPTSVVDSQFKFAMCFCLCPSSMGV